MLHDILTLGRNSVTRRRFLTQSTALAAAGGALSLRDMLAVKADELRKEGRAMILLWMAGGPSQMECFDPKPQHENGGGTEVISSSVPGIQVASYWPETAKIMQHLAVIRSMTNKEGNHPRATYQMHTGYLPGGAVTHPSFGSCVAQQIGDHGAELPNVVSIGRTEGAGFLGVDYEPFVVNNPGQMPQNVSKASSDDRLKRRLGLVSQLDSEFARRGAEAAVRNHGQLYEKASRLVLSPKTSAFGFDGESAETIARYGDSQFGRGCLLARRLVEQGVTFVEVRSGGWDTHEDAEERIATNAAQVDPGAAALVSDLHERGMLDRTVVLWTGEFGRTPRVNARGGRDHYPRAFNCWLAGGGIRGGQVLGATTNDGTNIQDRPVSVPDLLQTLAQALKVDPLHENISPLGRPLKVVDGGAPVTELFA